MISAVLGSATMTATLDPERIDPEVFARGHGIAIVSAPKVIVDAVCMALRVKFPGCAADWHYVGGHAAVLVLGDEDEVEAIRVYLRDAHWCVQAIPSDSETRQRIEAADRKWERSRSLLGRFVRMLGGELQ